MPAEKRRLPGGRGLYTDEEAFIGQGESFEGRRNTIPSQDGTYFCIGGNPYQFVAGGAHAANRIFLFPMLPPPDRDITVESVRVTVSTLSAGNNIRVALYTFDLAKRTLFKVPGTAATLSAASATTVTQSLITGNTKDPIRLTAGTVYYQAHKSSDAVLVVRGVDSTAPLIYRYQSPADVAGELPPEIHTATYTRSAASGVPIPGIVYLSRLWRDII